MPANPPTGIPRITPYLLYEDVAAALAWLGRAFGLRERMRIPGPEGHVWYFATHVRDVAPQDLKPSA